jgi:hypothetical protein
MIIWRTLLEISDVPLEILVPQVGNLWSRTLKPFFLSVNDNGDKNKLKKMIKISKYVFSPLQVFTDNTPSVCLVKTNTLVCLHFDLLFGLAI